VVWSFVYLALRHVLELLVLCWRSTDARRSRSWFSATSWRSCAASTHGPGSSPKTVRCLRRLAVSCPGPDGRSLWSRPRRCFAGTGAWCAGAGPTQRRGAAVWVPDIRVTSCDLRVLMDQPTEAISSHDPRRRRQDNWHAGSAWRRLPQGAMRAVAVVVVNILGQHRHQLPAAQDQHLIQHLPPNRATHRSA
jgi:hypothetical protein